MAIILFYFSVIVGFGGFLFSYCMKNLTQAEKNQELVAKAVKARQLLDNRHQNENTELACQEVEKVLD